MGYMIIRNTSNSSSMGPYQVPDPSSDSTVACYLHGNTLNDGIDRKALGSSPSLDLINSSSLPRSTKRSNPRQDALEPSTPL
jgi:hypothetical protein